MVLISIDLLKPDFMAFICCLESIGYEYAGLDKGAIHEGNAKVVTHRLYLRKGIYQAHLNCQYQLNKFGTTHNRRVKIYMHIDEILQKPGKAEHHGVCHSDGILRFFLRKIEDALEVQNVGQISYKDRHAIHSTISMQNKGEYLLLRDSLREYYEEIAPSKFRREIENQVIYVWAVRQGRFVHLMVCVELKNHPKRRLSKKAAKEEYVCLAKVLISTGFHIELHIPIMQE